MRTAAIAFATLLVLSLGRHAPALAVPLGTDFSYQGRLDEGGVAADGDYDFVFRLFDADLDGNQIGADVIAEDWPVAEGQFTVQLDFGVGAFAGEARWLEVAVRPGDSTDPHTVLSPRQPLTAAPYALFALNGAGSMWESNGADIHNLNAGHVGVGDTTPLAALHVQDADLSLAASALLNDVAIVEDSDAVLGLYSSGGGGFGSAVALGEISDGALVNKWAMYRRTSGGGNNLGFSFGADPNYSVNPTYLTIDPDVSFVGVNRSSRVSGAEYFGIQALADADDEYGGMYIRTDGETSWPFYGYHTGTESAWHYLDGETDDWHLYNDGVRLTVRDSGEVGIGTTVPQVPLHIQTADTLEFELLRLESIGEVQLTLEADTDNSGETQNPSIFFLQDGGQVAGRIGYRIGENNFQVMQEYPGSLLLGTDNAVRMAINSGGYVGIGTTSPTAHLHVSSNAIDNNDNSILAAGSGWASMIRGQNNNPADDDLIVGSLAGSSDGVYAYHENDGDAVTTYLATSLGTGYSVYAIGKAKFNGDVEVTGFLSKGSGSFKIDHPLDPENKYLYHSFVESPDMMNIYNGNATLDQHGEAMVQLPEWFDALNMDFRYQLTPIGAPGPNLYIAEEIQGNRFKIAGGTPAGKVSWQVTGIRHDPYANAFRIPVEQDKAAEDRGKYAHPEAYGKPRELQIGRITAGPTDH